MHYTVCDFVLDITQNSIEAGASLIEMIWNESPGFLEITVRDNGKGMTESELTAALDPFYTDGVKHNRRKVGLGLPFLEQVLQASEGRLEIQSEKGKGTDVGMVFNRSHIDTPPVGNREDLFFQVLCFDGDYELIISRRESGRENYRVTRSELINILGDLRLSDNRLLLKDFLFSQENEP